MKLIILSGFVGFVLGLMLSLLSYIKLEWIVFLLICLGFAAKTAFSWFKSNPKAQLVTSLVLPKVLEMVTKPRNKTTDANVKLETSRVILEFEHRGQTRRHIIPYDRKELSKHKRHQVHLIHENGEEIEVLHIPGAKHSHSPQELGGQKFKVINKLTQEIKYYDQQPPQFD